MKKVITKAPDVRKAPAVVVVPGKRTLRKGSRRVLRTVRASDFNFGS